jgi:hypothetical protein
MSESWASEAARKLKQRDANQVPERAAMVEKKRLIDRWGPQQWFEVCEHVKTMCNELNVEYGEDVVVVQIAQGGELIVQFRHGDAASEMRGTCDFSPSTDALRWSYTGTGVEGATGGIYHFDVNNDVVTLRNSIMLSCRESIAKQMLDGLLNAGTDSNPPSRVDSRLHEAAPIFTRKSASVATSTQHR